MSDLVGTQIVGFLTHRLICEVKVLVIEIGARVVVVAVVDFICFR